VWSCANRVGCYHFAHCCCWLGLIGHTGRTNCAPRQSPADSLSCLPLVVPVVGCRSGYCLPAEHCLPVPLPCAAHSPVPLSHLAFALAVCQPDRGNGTPIGSRSPLASFSNKFKFSLFPSFGSPFICVLRNISERECGRRRELSRERGRNVREGVGRQRGRGLVGCCWVLLRAQTVQMIDREHTERC